MSFDTRKSLALLALLAVTRSPRSRPGLAAALWPDADEPRARSSLRRTLSVTATQVGDALEISRSTVGLDASRVWCDLWEFHRLAALDGAAPLADAASLYRDDFLAGFSARAGAEFDHWQEVVAEEERQRLSRLLWRLVQLTVEGGDLDAAAAHCRRWLSLDELHEPAHRALMRVLAWSGQRSAALAQYRRCVRVLEEELGVGPLAETTALYEAIGADRLTPPPATPAPPGAVAPAAGAVAPAAGAVAPLAVDVVAEGPRAAQPVGQAAVVGSLVADLERAGRHGRVAVVSGPAGSGKTTIANALRVRMPPGSAWIEARCHPEERWLELGCVSDLLRSALVRWPAAVQALDPADAVEVGRLVPDLAGRHGSEVRPLETPGAQVRFFRSVVAALTGALEGVQPGVLFVDDAHHMDESSARLLAYLVRRLDDLHSLVVFTFQPELGSAPVLAAALEEAARSGRAASYEPRLFGAEEVAQALAAGGVEGVAPEELVRQTGGLPLLVYAYTEALGRSRPGTPGASSSGRCLDLRRAEIPVTARQLLADRLSSVSQSTSQVVSAAAVVGSGCDAELLRAISGRSAEEVADALDEATRHGLLVEHPPVRGVLPTYDFPYDALKRVAYQECGAARRRLLHSRAADTLARAASRHGGEALWGSVAVHLEAAGRGAEAAAWSWRAAQRSRSLYAHAETADHLRRALELGHPPSEAHVALADAMIALGRYRDALVELEQAAAAAASATEDEPGATLATIEHRLASVHERLGNWPVAAAHIGAALGLCGDEPVLRARLLADQALLAYRGADPRAAAMSSAALLAAESSGDARALAQARNVAGVLASLRGDRKEAERLLRASLEEADGLDDPGAAVAALNNLARLLSELGRCDDAIATAEEALRRGVQHGDVHRIAALHSNLADLLHAAGNVEESISHLKESAAGFAAVDADGDAPARVWTLVDW